ncbi:peptide chain release factor aRF-1 [Candidatus Woesearchaeota archaeon]|nr:peptide chain release factor aRF-1 [Candidatus Woesearchaeota archaeon]
MSLTAKQKYDLKKFVVELDSHRALHTELISVYIPRGYDMTKIINHLAQEQGTASNIKSASTRKNVISALERMIQHLKLFKQTPENGLAVFSGNVARQGQIDLRVWSIEPPIPLQTRIYRCDKTFQLDILKDMLEVKEMYGLVVMDRREGIIAVLKGKTITPLAKYTSNVPGKTKAGGQSSQRFERLREGAAKEFYTRLGEHVKDEFFGKPDLKGIIVGGPGPTKYDFVEGSYMPTELKNRVIAIKDLSYTDEFGLQELVDKSYDVLAEEGLVAEKKILGRFFDLLSTRQGMVSYGRDEVMKQLKNGIVDVLLLSESNEGELIAEFEEEAKKFGTRVEIISTETREGAQLRDFGGIAAILRYEINY